MYIYLYIFSKNVYIYIYKMSIIHIKEMCSFQM